MRATNCAFLSAKSTPSNGYSTARAQYVPCVTPYNKAQNKLLASSPGPFPAFQCCMLKKAGNGPGDAANKLTNYNSLTV